MLEPQLGMTTRDQTETARHAEKLGFGFLFRSDHLLPTDNRRGLDSPEAWTSMGAMAASTNDIKFGTMVSPIGFRNPALLAKIALTVHSYSSGRLQLGVGTGWYEAEYTAHGFSFPPLSERIGQFSEALQIISTMVRQERVDFDGKYFAAHTDAFPRPSGKLHLIVGGRLRKVIELAARNADEWNYFTRSQEEWARGKALLEKERGGEVVLSETGPYLLGRTQADLEENARKVVSTQSMKFSAAEYLGKLRKNGSPCGRVDEFTQQIGKRVDLGLNRFYFQFLVPNDMPQMELLADTLKHGL